MRKMTIKAPIKAGQVLGWIKQFVGWHQAFATAETKRTEQLDKENSGKSIKIR